MRFLLFGTGNVASQVMNGISQSGSRIEIAGVIDNDEKKQGGVFWGNPVKGPESIGEISYDYICILLERGYREVYNQLLYGYHVEQCRLVNKFFLLKQLMINKYQDSSDQDICATLAYWGKNNLTFFNQFEFAPMQIERVFWDTDHNMPYILYGDKRLYYPRGYSGFFVKDEVLCVNSYREMEQHKNSPHRYLTSEIYIKEGDIVVDAGAREGDFALQFIDKIKKLYLFECDPGWIRALEMTYKDYRDKVVIIPKMLSDEVSDETTTLSEVLADGKVDFIKMDIEGAEVRALQASSDLLKENSVRCAICCYHKENDRKEIEQIFLSNEYECSTSNGYVVFIADTDIFRTSDFRKGVVYAKK